MMMGRREAHFCCQKAERESHQVFGSGRFSGRGRLFLGFHGMKFHTVAFL